MRRLVVFRTSHGRLAAPVDDVRGVVVPEGIVPLPEARAGVAGLLRPDRDALVVLDVLRPGDTPAHVLVLEAGGRRFGLLVDEVTGVVRVGDDAVGPPPSGAAGPLVAGLVRTDAGNALLVDAGALAARL